MVLHRRFARVEVAGDQSLGEVFQVLDVGQLAAQVLRVFSRLVGVRVGYLQELLLFRGSLGLQLGLGVILPGRLVGGGGQVLLRDLEVSLGFRLFLGTYRCRRLLALLLSAVSLHLALLQLPDHGVLGGDLFFLLLQSPLHFGEFCLESLFVPVDSLVDLSLLVLLCMSEHFLFLLGVLG